MVRESWGGADSTNPEPGYRRPYRTRCNRLRCDWLLLRWCVGYPIYLEPGQWRYNHVHIARYVFNLAFENDIKVSVVSHPSLLKVPEDLEVRSDGYGLEFWPINLSSYNFNRRTSKSLKHHSLLTVAPPILSSLMRVKPKLTRFSVKGNTPMDTRGTTMKDVPMVLLFVATWMTPRRKLERKDRLRKPFNGSSSISD